MAKKLYPWIGLGGTFDHFHTGHQQFLLFASQFAENLVIGITNQELTRSKHLAGQIENDEQRFLAVKTFCEKNTITTELIKLTNAIGNTLTDQRLEALAVTTETMPGGEHINQLRMRQGLPEFPLHVCSLFDAADGQPLHSVRIRAGETDRSGNVYADLFKNPILLNDIQRQELGKPQGQLVSQPLGGLRVDVAEPPIILVGDSTIERFLQHQWPFDIGIFDKVVERKPATGVTLQLQPEFSTVNTAGTISPQLATAIQTLLKKHLVDSSHPVYLYVDGEEDLAAIPAVLLAPLGSKIYYGQPNVGLVEVLVTEEKKQQLANLIKRQ